MADLRSCRNGRSAVDLDGGHGSHLGEVYAVTSTGALIRIAGFGFCWGIGSALAGLGMNLLGIGLGMAIILGLSASLGSLIRC